MLVGFSMFHRTRHKEFVYWVLNDGKRRLPSRLALYDLEENRLIEEMAFRGPFDGLAIYSVFLLPTSKVCVIPETRLSESLAAIV